ncbi:VRR-NUC domain-containing protein [Agrobacterium sp. lyk4-40-TYG-31]|uniref:VRR-NUC domain-containing protein n=1 Tax=Agrobacterium sp. lyk4-40-TYG-31 TaxID=3040276 RepID=UPI00254F69F0|nr:VRR-NUC domain-containing protein [Agrobacterium sp. lyk4-40-TYG-31]
MNPSKKATSQTTRINGKRVVIRTSAKGTVKVNDAPIKESDGQAAQVRALRALPEFGRQFLLAGDMNSAKRGPRAQADAIATGMTPGEADLRIYIKGGALRMIENKVGKGRLSPAQVERHASLARLGHPVEVVRFTSTGEAATKAVTLVRKWLADNDNTKQQ